MAMRIDATVPVDRQPTFTVRPEGGCRRHHWYEYADNGVWCKVCDALLLRLSGRRSYRGRHRA
jgi:hypothetical protein